MPTPTAVLEVTDQTFATDVLERSKTVPVVVDFWAPWCGPCRLLGPIIERVAAEHGGEVVLAKLNTDENPRTATQYRIQGIPAVKAFKGARVLTEFTGALPEAQVRAFFQRIIPSPAERAARQAEELARAGDTAAAEAGYREILRTSPANADAIVGMATLLVRRNETAEASALLEKVPADRRARALKHRIFLDEFARKHATDGLETAAAASPRDAKARYRWGLMLAARGDYRAALDELLESIRIDKTMAEGAARKGALAVFDILGPDDPVTRDYQRKLSTLLF